MNNDALTGILLEIKESQGRTEATLKALDKKNTAQHEALKEEVETLKSEVTILKGFKIKITGMAAAIAFLFSELAGKLKSFIIGQ